MNFIFYDTETTGTNTSFDQILQFAAIYTDAEFNEIDRFEIRGQLLPHVVPSPGAMKVTGITVKKLTDKSISSHYQMMQVIEKKLRGWGAAIFIGYNSLNFDEHLLRQAFYQTLHPLYLTNTGGSTRLDLLRIVQATTLFAPDAIQVPLNEKGKSTYRLDKIAPANGFAHEHAHDALSDVEACIHLSKLLQSRAPELWNTFIKFSHKSTVADYISTELMFSLSEFSYNRSSSWIVCGLGLRPKVNSEAIVFNLTNDPVEFSALSIEDLAIEVKKRPQSLLSVRLNGGAIIMPASIAPPIAKASSLGMVELERRANFIRADQGFKERLLSVFPGYPEDKTLSPHVEERIYSGFFSAKDQKLAERFHRVPWEKRIELIPQFEDNRLKLLANRLMYYERPDLLDKDTKAKHTMAIAERLLSEGENIPWLTLPKALRELDALISESAKHEQNLLTEYRKYFLDQITSMKETTGKKI